MCKIHQEHHMCCTTGGMQGMLIQSAGAFVINNIKKARGTIKQYWCTETDAATISFLSKSMLGYDVR